MLTTKLTKNGWNDRMMKWMTFFIFRGKNITFKILEMKIESVIYLQDENNSFSHESIIKSMFNFIIVAINYSQRHNVLPHKNKSKI